MIARVLAAAVLLLVTGCTSTDMSCSCAFALTFEGRTYFGTVTQADPVPLDSVIGRTDPMDDCCGDAQPVVPVSSVEGISPDLVVATGDDDAPTVHVVDEQEALTTEEQAAIDTFLRGD